MTSFGGRFGVRAKLTAVLLALSATGLAGAWAIYENAAEVHLPAAAPADKEMDADLADVERMLAHTPPEAGRYEVIEQANLFSPERKALPRLAEGKADAPQEATKDVSLLGTTLLGQEKRAMLRIDQQQPPLVIVREGQSLGGDTQVVSIDRGQVLLRRGGENVILTLPAPDPAKPSDKGNAQETPQEGAKPQRPAHPPAKGHPPAKAAASRPQPPAKQAQPTAPAKPAPAQAQNPNQNAGQPGQAGQPAPPAAGWSVKN